MAFDGADVFAAAVLLGLGVGAYLAVDWLLREAASALILFATS